MKKLALAAALSCAVTGLAGCGLPVNKEVAAACGDGQIDAEKVLLIWQRNGVARAMRRIDATGQVLEVDTALWSRAGHKVQISIAVAAYCKTKNRDGIGTVLVRGSLQEDLGAMVNGHWMR